MSGEFLFRDCHVVHAGKAGKIAGAKGCSRPHVCCGAHVCSSTFLLAKLARSKRSTNMAVHQEISRSDECSMPGKH
jgi:hypothetical protein